MVETITHNHTTGKSIQQLHDITTRQQTAINSIQSTLATQQKDITAIKTTIADMQTSINHIIHSVSEIATKLGFQITLPPLLPLSPTPQTLPPTTVAVSTTTTTLPLTFATAVRPSIVAAAAATAPSLPIMAPSSPIKPSDSTHQILKHFSNSHIEFLFGTNIDNPMKQQIRLNAYFAVMPFEVLCVEPALKPSLCKGQEWTNAHNLFVEMYKLKYESKIFIFDPGGIFNLECFFDLEDKVDFEGMVMIRQWYGRPIYAQGLITVYMVLSERTYYLHVTWFREAHDNIWKQMQLAVETN